MLLTSATACGGHYGQAAGNPQLTDGGGTTSQAGNGSGSSVPACPGAVDLGRVLPCRSQQDCSDGLCEDPHSVSVGCAGAAQPDDCAQDGDCADGMVCVPSHAQCEPRMQCVTRCVSGSCADGEQCGSDGKCVPSACGMAFACLSGQVCRPTSSGADAHGCVPASCSGDGFMCALGSQCSGELGMDAHGCNVPRCDNGGTCPQNLRCDATSPTPDGCTPLRCGHDSDCDCGACVMGVCANQPFECVPQLL
jgi:hypothetical protein